jgi:hypothetical protein
MIPAKFHAGRAILVCLLLCTALQQDGRAVMITTLDGSGNTDDGGDAVFGEAFSNVTRYGSGSAIYLRNGWGIRPWHTAPGGGGSVFGQPVISGAGVRLHEIGNPSTPVDLVVFQLAADPGLPELTIRTSTPPIGEPVRMIGSGANREADQTFWRLSGDPQNPTWTETTNQGQADRRGYKPLIPPPATTRFGDLRWGTNLIDSAPQDVTLSDGVLSIVTTDFDRTGRTTHEAQAVGHDSGGAVVIFNSTTGAWELTGLMHSSGPFVNQPDTPFTAVFGNLSIISDLPSYLPQILPLIPEPSTSLLLLGGLVLLAGRRHGVAP